MSISKNNPITNANKAVNENDLKTAQEAVVAWLGDRWVSDIDKDGIAGDEVGALYNGTITNEDGDMVEYTSDFMRYRCKQMGVKTVPVLWKGVIPEVPERIVGVDANGEFVTAEICSAGEWIKDIAEQYYDGPDPIGKTHVREGVVVRILNRPKFCAYKHKNFAFKCLEGLVKAEAEAPDMEEAEEIKEV